jgi:hypothetical protein
VYNRGEKRVSEFKTYATGKNLPESAYKVVEDLRSIGKT